MIIEHPTKDSPNTRFALLNNYPDPFVSEKTKLEDEDYIKNTMDYFSNMAYTQYWRRKEGIEKNYRLLKGKITKSDFDGSSSEQEKDFFDVLSDEENNGLPGYVKHYSLLNQPINALIGELTKRPDVRRVRAMDDDSRSEELEYKTELVNQLILQKAREKLILKLKQSGQDISQLVENEEQFEQMTFDSVKEQLVSYTSNAEKWGNRVLKALKAFFNMKEKSEDGCRDLLISASEFYHLYEDTSKLGFNICVENPKNVWWKSTPDTKYISSVCGESRVPYCAGTIHVKEISELINEIPELTIEEIEHLKKGIQNSYLLQGERSNVFNQNISGIDSIKYSNYSPLLWQERMFVEAEMGSDVNTDDLSKWMGGENQFSFGYKFVVVTAYFNSKKKIGKLTYIDEEGDVQTTLVDETYKEGSVGEIDIEWGWVNQWMMGRKIGPDIYHIKPLLMMDYCPIIGMIYEPKNAEPKSLVDLMKPLQVLFNVVMNQIYQLLEKEYGNIAVINKRRVPIPKGADPADALDILESEMRDRGIMQDDDSPENTKSPVQNTSIARNIDLTRSNELQTRYNFAVQLQEMAWQLIGMNRQRLGAPLATETATANQNALVQSFAQTEPYFAAHDYLMNQVYQGIIDVAKYIEQNKPLSTISDISNLGENTFIQVMGSDLSFRDLKVMVTSRPEDQQLFNEFRQLSQAAIQNGASLFEVSQLFTTDSLREMQRMFKELHERQLEQNKQLQDNESAKIQQDAQLKQAEMEQEERHHQDEMEMEKYKTDVKANTELAKAEISTYFQAPGTDSDGDGTPDIIEIANHQLTLQESIAKRDLENKQLSLKMQEFQAKQKQQAIDNKLALKNSQQKDEEIKIRRKQANKPKASK